MKPTIWTRFALVVLVIAAVPAWAHVPYFEHRDWTQDRPFQVRNGIEQSIAVYSWIEFEGWEPATDVDYYEFEVTEPVEVYVEAIVPVCPGYEDIMPWFALIGPGLPEPEYELPDGVDIPEGYGAIVVPGPVPGEPREQFYEPFGGKSYYQGGRFEEMVYDPGAYTVIYWDPYEMGGDYVGVLGNQEIWGFRDIIRALIYTPLIRRDRELHIECPDSYSGSAISR